jgi:hypothetical protein
MTTELEPVEALQAKSTDFRRWIAGGRTVSPSIVAAPCPKCGGRVVCAYAEMGAVDFYDTYAHACLNPDCDYGETQTFFFHSNWGPDGPRPECPFCALLPSAGL